MSEAHKRKCWDCGNVAMHAKSIVPEVLCTKCGSQDTRRIKYPAPAPKTTVSDPFYREYRLLKPTPLSAEGTILTWDEANSAYRTEATGMTDRARKVGEVFTRDLVVSQPEWFEPMGDPEEFYPPFPSGDFLKNHFYIGELKHNGMCRFCSKLAPIIDSQEFIDGVYLLAKALYEQRAGRKVKEPEATIADFSHGRL